VRALESGQSNGKSHPIYRIVPLSMTLSDHWPGFEGHDIFGSRISECLMGQSYYSRRTLPNIWNGTMFGDLDWPLNASRGLSAIAEFLVPHYDVFSLLFL